MSEHQTYLLLIDDDESFGHLMVRALARRGWPVECLHSASAVETWLDLPPPHLPERVVLDLNLAGDSGLRLLPRLREALPESKILVLTGFASIATAVDAIKLGADNYLAKPASADDILHALDDPEPNPEQAAPEAPMSVRRLAWEHIQRVLAEHDGNISATARALNMHRRTLQRMLAKKPVSR